MNSKRASVILPLLSIGLVVAGMTQQAFAASISDTPRVKSATSGVTAIDQLRERSANRGESRLNDEITTPTQRRSSSSSARSSGSNLRKAAPQLPADSVSADVLQEVFRLVNAERAKQGLSAYAYNSTLQKSANDYSKHMKDSDCFSHTECGSTLKERMHASGYYQGGARSYSYGENIARGQETANKVMEDWMNSPPHKAAILSTKYKEIGVGRSGNYWTQHFGAIR